jgi:IclR family mhp operon transcriptional activator
MSLDPSQHLSTLSRGLEVLTHINIVGAVTIGELARTLGLSRGTSHRILETLAADGYLLLDQDSRRYTLTPQVQRLSAGYQEESAVARVTQPLLLEFSRKFGWPFSFAVPVGVNMAIRVTSEYHSPLSLVRVPAGYTYPILQASAGIAFLAYCTPELQAHIMAAIKDSADPRQSLIHDQRGLSAILKQTLADGFCALDNPAIPEGGIGAPIMIDGRPIGGLLMRFIKSAVPAHKISTDLGPLVVRLAEQVSAACAAAGIGQTRN